MFSIVIYSVNKDMMLVLLCIWLSSFTAVVTAKTELYQIEWFHSDTVNIQSILCEAWYGQRNLSTQSDSQDPNKLSEVFEHSKDLRSVFLTGPKMNAVDRINWAH